MDLTSFLVRRFLTLDAWERWSELFLLSFALPLSLLPLPSWSSVVTAVTVLGMPALIWFVTRRFFQRENALLKQTIRELEESVRSLDLEKQKLTKKMRVLVAGEDSLRRKNESLLVDAEKLSQRLYEYSERSLRLNEALLGENEDEKIRYLKESFWDKISDLMRENNELKKALSSVKASVECGVCRENACDSLINPCCHSICRTCYEHIRMLQDWAHSASMKPGPLCPFCRAVIEDVTQRYRS